jgi:hypothetical protein
MISMSSSKRGGTKLLYCVGRDKMKGDASIWRVSHFRINARHTTMSMSPFAMKCEMRLYYACLSYKEKEDAHTKEASHIRSPSPKISSSVLSLATLINFLKPPSALAVLSP